ncbi:hypothetical protein GCM10010121_060200 [Streptomyces brasiliensis]|uniref:Uncharacterized protein n=1 Tax=Streptomyces brasiliensis TaxID=1954 RepID=A0A917L3G8_9ACTN|nr:hypothetical protein GCM10010121_060200 [Streptomyces brasiliensis]
MGAARDRLPPRLHDEITYTLTHEAHPPIVLPASFGVDFGPDDRIVAWRDYSRAWIPGEAS